MFSLLDFLPALACAALFAAGVAAQRFRLRRKALTSGCSGADGGKPAAAHRRRADR